MNRKSLALLIAIVTFTVGIAVAKLSLPLMRSTPTVPPVEPSVFVRGNYVLSGPYTHENLSIFLIHGPDAPNGKKFVALQEALEQKLVVVHETSDVNELWIENLSKTEEVFVQSGDIVKGGQQDRVLAVDLILPARSGKQPIASFCVEQSRWQARGNESVAQFNSSSGMLTTRSLKMATKHEQSQAKVWSEVAAAQERLSSSARTDVRSSDSRSSLQLSIENKEVLQLTNGYTKKLSSIIDGKNDVIGFAFAINQKINSADIYYSNDLFRRIWPKLLNAAAIEAVAERTETVADASVTGDLMAAFFTNAEQGPESTNEITERTHLLKREGKNALFFETRDMAQNGIWVHRSYLAD